MRDLARVSTLIGYQELVRELGGNPTALLRKFHLEPMLLEKEDNMIPYRSIIRLLEATADALNCPDFGLRLAQKQGFNVVGPLSIIGLNSKTVYHALKSIFDHIAYYSPAMSLEIDTTSVPDFPRIIFHIDIPTEPKVRQAVELAVSLINKDLKALTGKRTVAQQILFSHRTPLPLSVYKKHFDTNVYFEQEVNAVVVRKQDLDLQLTNADESLRKIITEYVVHSTQSQPESIEDDVRRHIRQLLATSNASLTQVAWHLCMHERTLQRKLKERGLIFEEIVDSVRKEKAFNLLTESSLPMSQISILLGYSDQASLNRSCRRWFGKSPSSIRRGSH